MNESLSYLCKTKSELAIIKNYYIKKYNTDCSCFKYKTIYNKTIEVTIYFPVMLMLVEPNKFTYSSRIVDYENGYGIFYNNTKKLLRKIKLNKING